MVSPRYLTEDFAVSPQISVEDVASLKEQGFATVVCNRPDDEVPTEIDAAAIRSACEAAGLDFVLNPLSHGSLTMDHVDTQRAASEAAKPVLAYCASGNRSSIMWALAMAGQMPTDEIVRRTTEAGYNVQGMIPQIEAIAQQRSG